MSFRITQAAFHSVNQMFRIGRFAPISMHYKIGERLRTQINQKWGMHVSNISRSYATDTQEKRAYCAICPMPLIYGEKHPNQSNAHQKMHFKSKVALGLGLGLAGLTLYSIEKVKKAAELNAPPNYAEKPPRNLAFKGGGQKGIVYPAALKELERQGALKQVKRVAGTSAGAITAALLAVGYTPDELEEIADKTPMESFMDYPGAGVISPTTAVGLKMIKKAQAVLSGGIDAASTTALYTSLSTAQQIFEFIFPGASRYTKPLVELVGDKATNQREQVLHELTKLPTLCPGEKFREWMEKMIHQKTGIKHCTFGELDKLAKEDPKKYKELYVFAAQLNGADQAKIIRVGTTSEELGPPCKDLVISDAVRCSMSIPFVFKPHMLYYKNVLGGRSPYSKLGELVDGGILYNFPIDAFDDLKKRGANRRTLGLGFEIQKMNSEPVPATFRGILASYENFQESLDDMRPHNTNRMILLPTQGVGTIPKMLSPEKKRAVIEGARKKVEEAFEKYRSEINARAAAPTHWTTF